MAETVWQKGKLTQVFHPVGKRESDQSPRFRRASYDLLEWTPPGGVKQETFVLPRGFETPEVNLAGHDAQRGMEFGYYTGKAIVTEIHQSSGQDSGWIGVHTFGYV